MSRGGSRTRSGPPRKPTTLGLLHGSKRSKARAPNEPAVESGPPPKPEWLGEIASQAWDDVLPLLLGMRVVSTSDRMALEMLASTYEEWRDANDAVQRDGATQEYHTQAGSSIRAHPAVAQRSDAFRRLHTVLQEFGLTPASRSKAGVTGQAEKADPLAELMSRATFAPRPIKNRTRTKPAGTSPARIENDQGATHED